MFNPNKLTMDKMWGRRFLCLQMVQREPYLHETHTHPHY